MAKRRGRARPAKATLRPKTRKPAKRGRINTIPSNGDQPTSTEIAPEPVSVGEAMRQAVEALGDVQIDETLAPSQLRQLAEAYEEVAKTLAAFNAKNDAAKVAKKAHDIAIEFLLERVKSFTHPSPLPLFDEAREEADRAAMVQTDSPTPEPGWPGHAEA